MRRQQEAESASSDSDAEPEAKRPATTTAVETKNTESRTTAETKNTESRTVTETKNQPAASAPVTHLTRDDCVALARLAIRDHSPGLGDDTALVECMAVYHIYRAATRSMQWSTSRYLTEVARMHETYRQITHRHSGVEDTGHGTDWCRFYGEVMGDNHPSSSCSLNQYHVWWENASHITTTLVGFTKQMIDAALRAFLPTLSTESKQPIATSPPGETKSTESRTATETKQPADDSLLVPWISPRRGLLQAQLEAKSQSASTVTEVASTTTLWNHERLVALARSVHWQNPGLRDVGSGILVRRLGVYHIYLCQRGQPVDPPDLVDQRKLTATCRHMVRTTPFPSDHGVTDWCRFFAEVCGTHSPDTCSLESCRHQWEATTYIMGQIVSAVQSLIQTGLDSLALPTAATTRPASAPPTTTSASAVPTPEAKTEAAIISGRLFTRAELVALARICHRLPPVVLSIPRDASLVHRMALYHIYTMGTNTRVPEGDLTNEARISDNYRGLDQYTLVGDGAVSGLHGSHWCQFYAEVVGGFHAPDDCSLYDCRRWWLDTSIPTSGLARLTKIRIETALQHTAAQVAAQESKTDASAMSAPRAIDAVTWDRMVAVAKKAAQILHDGGLSTPVVTHHHIRLVQFHAYGQAKKSLRLALSDLGHEQEIQQSIYGLCYVVNEDANSDWHRFLAESSQGLSFLANCTPSNEAFRQWFRSPPQFASADIATAVAPALRTAILQTLTAAETETKTQSPPPAVAAPLPVSTYTNTALVNRLRTLVIPPLTDPDADNFIHTMLRTMVYFHAFRCLINAAVGLTNAFQIKVSYNDVGRGSQSSYAHGSEWCRFYHAVTAQPGGPDHAPEACSLAIVRNTIDGHLLRPIQYYEEVTRNILVDLAHDPEPVEAKAEAKTEVAASAPPLTHRERVIRIARRAIDRLVTDSTQHGCYLSQVIRFHAWRHSQEGGNYYDNREAFLTERNVHASVIGWSYSTTREPAHGSDWCRFYNDCVAVRSHGATACQSTAFRAWYHNVDLNADDLTRIVLPYLREAVNHVYATEVPPAQASPTETNTETKQPETSPRDRLIEVARHAHNHPVNAYTGHQNTTDTIAQATTFHLFRCATLAANHTWSDWISTDSIKDTLDWIHDSEELPAEGSDWCRFYRQVFGPAQAPRLCNCNSINHAKYWIRSGNLSLDEMARRIHATLEAAWNATAPIQPLVEDETKAISMEVDSEPAAEDPPEAPGPPIDVDVTEIVSSDVDRTRLVAVAKAVNTTRLQRNYDAQTRRFLKRIAVYHAFRCIEPDRGLRSLDDESEIRRTYNSLRTDTARYCHGSDWCEFYQEVTPPERSATAGTHRACQCSISGIWVNMGMTTLSNAQLIHLTAGILRRALADTASNGPSATPIAVASS